MIDKIIIIFKFIEPLFWISQVLLIWSLIGSRSFFKGKLKAINWFIKCQGFDIEIQFTEKSFKIWYRDVWILFLLNPLIIVLIHLI